jgi:hypothetical protein
MMIKHNPLSIAELKARLYSIRKPHQEHTQGLKPSEKLALLITRHSAGYLGQKIILPRRSSKKL